MYMRLKLVNISWIICRFDKFHNLPSLIILRCSVSRMCNSTSLYPLGVQQCNNCASTCTYIYILCSYAIREQILGHLVEFIYHNAWFNLESSRGHTQITCFRGLDIGARCFYFCFSFLKLWNFIWSIQFTCNKCGIRKLKYMYASLMLFLSLYISIRST